FVDLARLDELARLLVVVAAGFVVAFALDLAQVGLGLRSRLFRLLFGLLCLAHYGLHRWCAPTIDPARAFAAGPSLANASSRSALLRRKPPTHLSATA